MENKIVAGIIGLEFGRAHLEGALAYGAEIGLICDCDEKSLKFAADKYNIPYLSQSIEIGVRVEVRKDIMESITNVIYDPIKKRSTVVMSGFEYSVPYLLNM